MKADISVDAQEIAHFSAMAEKWWDESGPFRPLHRLNPVRIAYVRALAMAHFGRADAELKSLNSLSLLDIGCGGGLMAEPMARMGAAVTGIDASEKNIVMAAHHAAQGGLTGIDYRAMSAEALAETGAQFDMVLALEIIEHVADIPAFMAATAKLTKPGGLLVMSTLNRTAKSFALAIVGAEYILRWLPRGTHHWKKFLRPSELCREVRQQGFTVKELQGLVYHPLTQRWRLDHLDLDVNYLLAAIR